MALAYIDARDVQDRLTDVMGPHSSAVTCHVQRIHLLQDWAVDRRRLAVALQHPLAIPNPGGGGYVATLLPVDQGRRRSIMAPFAASVAVFAQDPAEVPLMPGEAFARLYGLTGAEHVSYFLRAQTLSKSQQHA